MSHLTPSSAVLRVGVIGGGAWGLPAAAELAARGHRVTLVDGHGVGNALGSSSGPTRLWRLSHPDRLRVRLAQRAVEAWKQLEAHSGRTLLLDRGLLWRGESAAAVASALAAENVDATWVDSGDVARFFPGLRPNGQAACWQPAAGPVLAADALAAQLVRFELAGGQVLAGRWVTEIELAGAGARLVLGAAGADGVLDVDAGVVAAGPWTPALLPSLGLDVRLEPVLEQVAYLEGEGSADLPCLFDAPLNGEPGLYAMPSPGLGYKIGLDQPLRPFDVHDLDRTPDPGIDAVIEARVARDFAALVPRVRSSQVCSWTDAPDGRFVIDASHDGRVVLACGDSGEGFKFSALLGQLLADRVEGLTPDADVATFARQRLADLAPSQVRTQLGD